MQKLDRMKMKNDNLILEMRKIEKKFPGVKALKEVDFQLRKGEVHGLVGENGAGKSTLVKILMGVYAKDSGEIFIDERNVDIRRPEDAHNYGIGMIFQELSLVPQLNVAQNIYLGIEPRRKLKVFTDNNSIYKNSEELMNKYNILLNPKEIVGNLNRGYSQMVEILKVLAQNAKIIIMDEPTSSLTKSEEDTLYKIIVNLKDQGVSIIYISHRLREIFNICDRVTVLKDGLRVATKNIEELKMEKLVEMMTGKILKAVHHHEISSEESASAGNILEVKGLVIKPKVNNVSFGLRPGEILGITGLMGSGKSEIAKALFGIIKTNDGEIYIDEKKLAIKTPSDAINAGIFLVPEDRRNEGLILCQNVEANLTLPIVNDISKAGFVSGVKSAKRALYQINKLSIKTPSIKQETTFLSGGNQQKVVVGKWLMENPKILVLDEPTVGIDVSSKVELRNIISDLVSSYNCSIILFSSELNEIIQLVDRIIVLYKGAIFKEFSNVPIIKESILLKAVQGIA